MRRLFYALSRFARESHAARIIAGLVGGWMIQDLIACCNPNTTAVVSLFAVFLVILFGLFVKAKNL